VHIDKEHDGAETPMMLLLVYLIRMSNARFVAISFCHDDEGIGSWLQRSCALPFIISKQCDGFQPIFKDCDLRGHLDIYYGDFFIHQLHDGSWKSPIVNQGLYSSVFVNRTFGSVFEVPHNLLIGASTIVQLCAVLSENAYAESHALITDDVLYHSYAEARSFLRVAQPLTTRRSVLRVGIHWRMGDVFFNSLEAVDVRSIPLSRLREILAAVRASCDAPMRFFVFVQLPTSMLIDAIDAMSVPNVTFAVGTEETVKEDLRLAAIADVLVVGTSSFGRLMAMLNPSAVLILDRPDPKFFAFQGHRFSKPVTAQLRKDLAEKCVEFKSVSYF